MLFSVPRLAQLFGALTILASFVYAIDTITTKDRHFVNSNTGDVFWIKGVDYQPGGSETVGNNSAFDPLSNAEACARDVYLFQLLGINTVRVYSVDPTVNHDACMSYLAAAGIYLVLDVNSPIDGQHLNRYEPWTTYTEDYLSHIFSVIEAFKGYDNTLAFLAGNEVINDNQSAAVSPRYQKAVVRDMKNYIANHVSRDFPVGYSAADNLLYRYELPAYLSCGDVFVDFYAVNTYQWCGDQTFQSSGYDSLTSDYQNYSQPIFFSEFGCNLVKPRTFQEVGAIFSTEMTGVFSGALAYEFTQETNDYGLVEINGTSATLLNDYTALQTAYKNVSTVSEGTADSVTRPTTCPPQSNFFNINATTDLPDTPASDLIKNGVSSGLYSAGKLITPSNWSTSYEIMDQSGDVFSNTEINHSGYTPSNPANGGSGSSSGGNEGSGNGTSTSGAGQLNFDTMLGMLGVGLFAWNTLA